MLLLDAIALFGQKRTWVWVILHQGLALVLCLVPGLRLVAGTPGYEFAFLTGILTALGAGHLGVMAATRARACGPYASGGVLVFRAWLSAWIAALLVLALPLVTVLVAGIWNGRCDYAGGILFFLILPVMSAALSAAVGVLVGLLIVRRFLGALAFFAVAMGSLAFSIHHLLTEAPIFAYDPFFGYFAGAIYDELITVRPSLVLFRVETAFWVVAALSVARTFADPVVGRLRWNARRFRGGAVAIVALAGALAMRAHGGDMGYFVTTDYIANTLGGRYETEHFVIHYPKGASFARHLEDLALDHEFRYQQLRRYLGKAPGGKVHSFLYATPRQKARLMGARHVSIAKPWLLQLHLHDMGIPHPVLRHELAHVFGASFGSWFGVSARSPFSFNVGLIEGMAVAADWSLGLLSGHQWTRAAQKLKGKRAPRIENLMGASGFWGHSASLAYTVSGSFVRFLIEKYGAARFRECYGDGDFERAYGMPLKKLVAEWQARIDSVTLGPTELAAARRRFRVPSIFARTCAHEVARLGRAARRARRQRDYGEEVSLRRQMLALNPKSIGHHERLARALLRAGRDRDAEAMIERGRKLAPKEAEVLEELLGDVSWRGGRLRRAREIFGRLLRDKPTPAQARRLAIKIAAIDHPRVGPEIRRFLTEDSEGHARIAALRAIVRQAPNFSSGQYLLGRHLYFYKSYAEAGRYLQRAVEMGLPGLPLSAEARGLLGLTSFHLKDYAGARRSFVDLMRSGLSRGTELIATDWIARVQYYREHWPRLLRARKRGKRGVR